MTSMGDYSTEVLDAEIRRQMEAHWHIKLKACLTPTEIASLYRAYVEDTNPGTPDKS